MTRLLRFVGGKFVQAESLSFGKIEWAKVVGGGYKRELTHGQVGDDDGDGDGHDGADAGPILERAEASLGVAVSEGLEANERALQELIAFHPEIIPWEALYGEGHKATLITREFRGIDLLFLVHVAQGWRLLVMETKLVSNPDMRRVVAQVLDYAARLWLSACADRERFEKRLRKSAEQYWRSRNTSLEATLEACLAKDHAAHWTAAVDAARKGDVLALIVADDLPADLRTMLAFLPASVLLQAVRIEPLQVKDGAAVVAATPALGSSGASAAAQLRDWLATTLDLKVTEVGLRAFDDHEGLIVGTDLPPRRFPPGPPTTVNKAATRLKKTAAELIKDGRIGTPKCFKGYSVGTMLRTDLIDKMKMRIRYHALRRNATEDEKRLIHISFSVKGQHAAKEVADLQKMLAPETGPLEEMLGVKVEGVQEQKGLGWMVPAAAAPQPLAAESLALWMARIYRHFTDRLPQLRAQKTPKGE